MESAAVAPENSAGGLRAVFRHRIFAMVWAGALISNIGNWMENSAANWAVVSTKGLDQHQAAFLSGLLNFADFLPALLLSLVAGVIADRVNLRRYLLWLQIIACLLGAGLAVAAYLGYANPTVVIAFTFAEGIIWALNGPPWLSVVPHLVPRNELPSAVAASSVQFNLGRVIGPVVAGVVVAVYGLSAAFFVNAITFIPLLIVLWRLPSGKKKESPGPHARLRDDLSAGLKTVYTHPGLRRLSMMLAISMFLAAPATGLLAPYVQQRMNASAGAYGWMLGAIGVGAFLGALCIRRIPDYYPRHHLIPLATSISGMFMLLFTFTRHPWEGFLALVGMGFFWMLGMNSTNAAMQLLASDTNRGRVMSVMLLCNTGFLPLGHLCAAGLATFMGTQWVMRIMEGTLVLAAFAFLLRREPAIDAMKPQGMKLGWWQQLWEAVTAQSHRPVPQPVREEMAREQGQVSGGDRVIG